LCGRDSAESKSQRMAPAVLHIVPAAGGVLRAQHVRRRRRRKLPQVQRESGTTRSSKVKGPGGKASVRVAMRQSVS